MKIYFAGSIRGGREDAALYASLIGCLKEYGNVLTEHVGAVDVDLAGEEGMTDRAIHDRDVIWLRESDVVVAEVTIPSHGVGYEISLASMEAKPILCLHRPRTGRRLSAMIAGCPGVELAEYRTRDDAARAIDGFFKTLSL